MISQPKQKIYEVPCKNKITNGMIFFNVIAFSFSDAIFQLECELLHPLEWIIGYGSM